MNQAKDSTEVLKAALWIIDNVGWVKGTFHKEDWTGFCALGAINMVDATPVNKYEAKMRLVKLVPNKYLGEGLMTSIPVSRIANFNDHPKTTKKKVINLFKKAIEGKSK